MNKRKDRDWDRKNNYSSYSEEDDAEDDMEDDVEEEEDESGDSYDAEEEDQEIERLEAQIKSQLSNVKFGTLVRLQKEKGKAGGRERREDLERLKRPTRVLEKKERPETLVDKHRERDDAPLEMTAMRPVSRMTTIVPNKTKVRDPRFGDLHGKFNEREYRHNYKFLDNVRQNEIEKLKTMKRSLENPREDDEEEEDYYQQMNKEREINKLNKLIQSKQSRLQTDRDKDKRRELYDSVVEREVESVKKGKKPFQLSKKAFKEIELKEKFKQLKETGQLDKFLEKRRKKESQKEKVFIPRKRRAVDSN